MKSHKLNEPTSASSWKSQKLDDIDLVVIIETLVKILILKLVI